MTDGDSLAQAQCAEKSPTLQGPKQRMQIVFDTDFIIKVSNDPLPKLDWNSLRLENELLVLSSVIRELNGLSERKDRNTSKRARNALKFLESGQLRVVPDDMAIDADVALIRFAEQNSNERIVATLDGDLLSALEKNHMGYLTLSSNKPLIHRPGQQRI